jgi:signal transduction histidine kinase
MFELFPDQPVYDYPTLLNVFYSLIWAFVLSSIIAITHRVTFSGHQYPKNFFQGLALGSIVAALVMMAIGDSLARGLGAFGALAMIRFRTKIQDVRNILFIFASLSVGLAIGVFGYTIAFVGTILFCTMALVLHLSPFSTKDGVRGTLTFRLEDGNGLDQVLEIMKRYCAEYDDVEITARDSGRFDYEYQVEFKDENTNTAFMNEMKAVQYTQRVRISFKEFLENN